MIKTTDDTYVNPAHVIEIESWDGGYEGEMVNMKMSDGRLLTAHAQCSLMEVAVLIAR